MKPYNRIMGNISISQKLSSFPVLFEYIVYTTKCDRYSDIPKVESITIQLSLWNAEHYIWGEHCACMCSTLRTNV